MFDPTYLMASLVFSSIGLGYFIYGKRQKQKIIYYSGLALMVYPYLITTPSTLVLIGIALMAAPKIVNYLNIDF